MSDEATVPMPEQEGICEKLPNTFEIGDVWEIICTHYPELWPAAEAGLSTCATTLAIS